jgi:hypothetical protein
MSETLWGWFCLVTVLGVILFCFRHALPLNSRTREGSEINEHSSYGPTESGSNWSSHHGGGGHHGS